MLILRGIFLDIFDKIAFHVAYRFVSANCIEYTYIAIRLYAGVRLDTFTFKWQSFVDFSNCQAKILLLYYILFIGRSVFCCYCWRSYFCHLIKSQFMLQCVHACMHVLCVATVIILDFNKFVPKNYWAR